MKTVILLPLAKGDLADIWAYSVERWGAEPADLYISKFASIFSEMAEGEPVGSSADWIKPNLRRVLVGQHAVYFRESAQAVHVIRVLHQRMDAGRRV